MNNVFCFVFVAFSQFYYTVPGLVVDTWYSIIDASSMPGSKIVCWCRGHVANIADISRCRNCIAHCPSFHWYLQYYRSLVDVCLLQVKKKRYNKIHYHKTTTFCIQYNVLIKLFCMRRDSFITKQERYRWAESFSNYRDYTQILFNKSINDLQETVPDYFSGIVLQRHHSNEPESGIVTLKFQVAFNLAVVWMIVFVSLSKGNLFMSSLIGVMPLFTLFFRKIRLFLF